MPNYPTQQVWRGRILDAEHVITGVDQTIISPEADMLDVSPGYGEELIVGMRVTSKDGTSGAAQCILQIESEIPGGGWHLVARFARILGSAAGTTHRVWKTRAGAQTEFDDADSTAPTTLDTADVSDDFPITGRMRARYLLSRGAATSITWVLMLDVAVAGKGWQT